MTVRILPGTTLTQADIRYYYDSFTKSNASFAYRIKELRNKKLVPVSEKNMVFSYADGEKYWFESEYEFAQ